MARSLGWLLSLVWLLANAAGCSNTTIKQQPARLVGELGMNDVSILFPLPDSGRLDDLLAADTQAAHGELLPRSWFSQVPDLLGTDDAEAQYARLRVVSVRFDPCFPSLQLGPSPNCRFQVRLVLSPLQDDAGEVRAQDAAVHLFYELSAPEFSELLGALLEAKRQAAPTEPTAPLSVQPTLAAEGLSGPFAQRLRALLIEHVGASRLSRMTFTTVSEAGNSWSFGGFDLVDGELIPVGIASSDITLQVFENTASDPLDFAGGVSPPLPSPSESLNPLYDSAIASNLSEPELWPLYEALLRIENPERHSPESVDCVSCHTAGPARGWVERHAPFAERTSELRYASSFELGDYPAIDDTTRVLRAFGYDGARHAISQRVVNDSAAVASYLNEQVLAAPRK
jgi:hypothetical protein